MKTKVIIINDDIKYKRFLRHMKYYKSILYFNTYFDIKNNINNMNINAIEEALNIKKRKARIAYIYDTACKIIDDNTKGINICGFINNKCYMQRRCQNKGCNGCCRKCIYQSITGCTTKNLACKLFNCSEVKTRFNVIKYEDLDLLKLLSIKQRFIVRNDYFSRREDVLKDLYSYSFIYSGLRITYRLIKNYIKKKV